jgi:hypothetical protein
LATLTAKQVREGLKLANQNLATAHEHNANAADPEMDADTRATRHAQGQHAMLTAVANYAPLIENVLGLVDDLESQVDRLEGFFKRIQPALDRMEEYEQSIKGYYSAIESTNVQHGRMITQLSDTLMEIQRFKSDVQPLVDAYKAKEVTLAVK